MSADRYTIDDLLRVMERLRDPDRGCPWDLEQDFNTIAPATLEEAYELVESIEQGDLEHVAEESGDLLFQVIFYAQMASEQGLYDFRDVVHTLVEKLVRRHPHVFADGDIEGVVDGDDTSVDTSVAASVAASVESVVQTWEAIKQEERKGRAQHSAMEDMPLALPALSRAQKIQRRAANVGFDWPEREGVLDKLREETAEFQAAAAEGGQREEEELGDILFTCVNLARHSGIDAETALRRASSRFEARFRRMEKYAQEQGTDVAALSSAELDTLWERAKRE